MSDRRIRFLFAAVAMIAIGFFAIGASAQCMNTCGSSGDGECDDGGPGSLYNICPLGTDCTDCGPRGGGVCNNSCPSAGDNECDDGGPGSLYDICAYGSDCTDCGVRAGSAPVPVPTPIPTPAAGGGCTNTCGSSGDGECDDGGPGSLYNICPLGSDCADCGPRGGCSNTCQWAADGECDDGGPGAINSLCPLGSDCSDCGPR